MPDDSHLDSDAQGSLTHRRRLPRSRRGRDLIQITWQSYAELDYDPPSWLIEGLIPAKSLIMLYGRRGQGKTFFALDIAASIASGRTCLGHSIPDKGKVCYLLAERPEGVKRRLRGWLKHREANESDIADVFVTGVEGAAVDTREGREYVIASIKEQLKVDLPSKSANLPATGTLTELGANTLRLLIIDPLAAHMTGSENETQHMASFVKSIRMLSKELGCSVLLVHHEGKRNFNNMLGARGSSALEAGLDTILYMRSDDDDKDLSELQMTKQREFEESPTLWLKFQPVELTPGGQKLGKFPILGEAPAKAHGINKRKEVWREEMKDEAYRFVCEVTSEQSDERGISQVTIEGHLVDWGKNRGIPEKFIKANVYDRLVKLRDSGLLDAKQQPGRGRGYFYLPVAPT